MKRNPKQEYTAEFKEQAVNRASEAGLGAASRELRARQKIRESRLAIDEGFRLIRT